MINFILKLTFVPLIAVILLTISSVSFAQSWKNSPYNWKNSPSNWQNSPNNWRNSPNNWKNSPNNYNANNGVYDNRGNRTGYTVQRKDGSGVNIFDNQGNRTGYFNK
jgi:hypothetical protein